MWWRLLLIIALVVLSAGCLWVPVQDFSPRQGDRTVEPLQ
jgi:hypothetical protein